MALVKLSGSKNTAKRHEPGKGPVGRRRVHRDRDGRKIREDWGENKQNTLFIYICIKLPKNKQLKSGQQWIPVLVRHNEEGILFISANAVHH